MRELDGADAGGQFVRTALALSAIENEPVRIENVRGGRSTPGLRPQHLAVVETLAAICDATVSGADEAGVEVGSETVAFAPGYAEYAADGSGARIPGGEYAVDIGTAGSVTLLFQALCPLATRLDSPLVVTATGGTDVQWSPPLEYFRHVTLPVLRDHGLVASVECDRRGFHPAGGGRATLRLAPSDLAPIDLPGRDERAEPGAGAVGTIRLYSTESASLADREVASRQLEGALERLSNRGSDLEPVERVETTAVSESPGSAIVLRLEGPGILAGFDALGERGKPAERVGEDAADAAIRFLDGTAPVDRHLADQLLVYLALAGGRIIVPAVTDHVETNLALFEAFDDSIDRSIDAEGTAVVARETR